MSQSSIGQGVHTEQRAHTAEPGPAVPPTQSQTNGIRDISRPASANAELRHDVVGADLAGFGIELPPKDRQPTPRQGAWSPSADEHINSIDAGGDPLGVPEDTAQKPAPTDGSEDAAVQNGKKLENGALPIEFLKSNGLGIGPGGVFPDAGREQVQLSNLAQSISAVKRTPRLEGGEGSEDEPSRNRGRWAAKLLHKLSAHHEPSEQQSRLMNSMMHKMNIEPSINSADGADPDSTDSEDESNSGSSMSKQVMPFVGRLALESFQLSDAEEPIIAPVEVNGTVLFVDLSGYSQVARLLESAGAVALFEAVNAYIERIVEVIVNGFGGEVVKYAGDAVMAVWYRGKRTSSRAVHCADTLQRDVGEHSVTGDIKFRIHIGIVHGKLTSHVLRAESALNMQKNYHFVSGSCLEVLEECVNAALPGETCVTQAVLDTFCPIGDAKPVEGNPQLFKLPALTSGCCRLAKIRRASISRSRRVDEADSSDGEDIQIRFSGGRRRKSDFVGREEQVKDFVHPKLRERFRHGLNFSQMAELRLLAVLFIHKSDPDVDAREWFVEVQQTLDDHRCPVVQVLDGDKGIHIVAAVNLFIADREPAVTAVRIAKMLEEREAGCTVGIACGMTFCGVVGSAVAARWDIVGSVCVRAARLMQHGLATGKPTAIGESVLEYSEDASLLQYATKIVMKGSVEPVKVFRIAETDTRVLACITSATRSCPDVHTAAVSVIQERALRSKSPRACVVLDGPPESGKAFVCVRSVHQTGVIPFVHTAPPTARDLSVIETIATWFSHHVDDELRTAAVGALQAFERGHIMKASRRGRALVNAVVSKGLKYALVIRQAQCLDGPSLSFLQHTLKPSTESDASDAERGKWLVFMCMVPQTGLPSVSDLSSRFLVDDVDGVQLSLSRMSAAEGAALVSFRLGWRCEPGLSDVILSLGGYLPGCVEKVIGEMEGRGLGRVKSSGIFVATIEEQRALRRMRWLEISPAVYTKTSQVADALGVTAKMILKTLRALSNPYLSVSVPFLLRVIQQVVPTSQASSVLENVDLLVENKLLLELNDSSERPCLPDEEEGEQHRHPRVVDFFCPATADLMKSVSLEMQVKAVAAVARELLKASSAWRDSIEMRLCVAHYEARCGNTATATNLFSVGWKELAYDVEHGRADRSTLLQSIAVDVSQFELDLPLAHLEDENLALSTRTMPDVILKLNRFRPPFSMGGLTHTWRQTAITLRELAVCAATDSAYEANSLEATRDSVRFFCRMIRIVDRHIGFVCPIDDEEATVLALLVNASFDEVCANAEAFFQYYETVLLPRIKASHECVERTMAMPTIPENKTPFWQGPQRVGMERAFDAVKRSWRTCKTTATRDGMMVMATQGWIPKNPDQTLEFQRDSYFRSLAYPMDCFPSLLHTNLCLYWDSLLKPVSYQR